MKHISTLGKITLGITIALLCMQVATAAVFEIQRVDSSDSLNLRAKPGAKSAVVGRIPHNGKWIRTDGRRVAVGRTSWIRINWQGKSGWVNEHFVRQMQAKGTHQPPAEAQSKTAKPAPKVAPKPSAITATALQKKGAWVLECGHNSPFWRVIVHPGKALDINLRGRNNGIIPLTYQKQDKNKWNTAMKTVLKGAKGSFSTDMTIRYTEQCHHTLSNQKVHYKVEAMLNGEQLTGCCRAIQLR